MRDARPPVSIGLPVYNGAEYLAAALDSLRAQTFPDFELIVSDNASTDDTGRICKTYAAEDARIRYYREASNRGAAWNFRRVFAQSRGEYFKWAAHDDVCDPELLARCVEILDRDPTIVLCCPRTAYIDPAGRILRAGPVRRPAGGESAAREARLPACRRRLDSRRPSERFRGILLHTRLCHEMFGLARADRLKRTSVHGDFYGADKVMLAELSLLGRIVETPDVLFFNRRHPSQSATMGSATQQNRYVDTAAARRFAVPAQVRCAWGYFASVLRARLAARERIACLTAFVPYFLQVRKWRPVLRYALRGVGIGIPEGERPIFAARQSGPSP